MKIALLNPEQDPHRQAVVRFARVAGSLGHETVECLNSQDIFREQPDFVLAMGTTQPKLTAAPTYAVVQNPREYWFQDPQKLQNLLTFDGYFAIADKLGDFVSHLLFALRREDGVGQFFFSWPAIDWSRPIEMKAARLACLDADASSFAPGLLSRLEGLPAIECLGDPGSSALDEDASLQTYRRAGAGLVLQALEMLADDIVPDSFFEICAAGAIAITPRLAWLERNFGDSVLYIDHEVSARDVALQIARHMEWIRGNPAEASIKAEQAHAIFKERFSLQKLIPAVLAYHAATRERNLSPLPDPPLISVIVRCGGRRAPILRRTLDSIAAQTHPRLELVLVIYTDFDPDAVLADIRGRFENVQVIRVPGGGRSTTLWAGLNAATGDYVSVLDDDDEWLPEHLTWLVRSLRQHPNRKFAYSGFIHHYAKPIKTHEGSEEVRLLYRFPVAAVPEEVLAQVSMMPLQTILFQRDLLDDWSLQDPHMSTGEDSYLTLSLLEKSTPVFSNRATTVAHRGDGNSNWQTDPNRREDENRLVLRYFGRQFQPAPRFLPLDGSLPKGPTLAVAERLTRFTPVDRSGGISRYRIPLPFLALLKPEVEWETVPAVIEKDSLSMAGETRSLTPNSLLPIEIRPPDGLWQYALVFPLEFPQRHAYVIQLHCHVESGKAGFGLLRQSEDDFVYRVLVPQENDDVIVELPVLDPFAVGPIVIESADDEGPVRVVLKDVQLLDAGDSIS